MKMTKALKIVSIGAWDGSSVANYIRHSLVTRVLQKVSALYFLKNLYLRYRHENNITFQYNLPSS